MYLLTCQYMDRMENKLSSRKVGLHFADFSYFELKRYAMNRKSERNLSDVFCIVHRSVSAHMFLLQALGYGIRYSVRVIMSIPPCYFKKRKKK